MLAGGSGLAGRDAVAVLLAESARQFFCQRVAVALAVGGAHEGADDFEVPVADVAGFAPQVGDPDVDVELEEVDAGWASGHAKKRRNGVGRTAGPAAVLDSGPFVLRAGCHQASDTRGVTIQQIVVR